jgi:hypothetical protein
MGAKQKSSPHIPERFLRQIWNHGLFTTENLYTTDGEPLEILSRGRLNRDSGPDFLDARIRIGGLVFCGNVELHKRFSGWNDHGHHLDPKYNAVILHVVFTGGPEGPHPYTKSKRRIPVLVLGAYLTSSYHDLWKTMIAEERSERLMHIACYNKTGNIDGVVMHQWLRKLAAERMELKVRRYEDRLKELIAERRLRIAERLSRYDEPPFGLNPEELPTPEPIFTQTDFTQLPLWEQILFESIMEALGYTKNQQPMIRLARAMHIMDITSTVKNSSGQETVTMLEALLFNKGGLLSIPRSSFDKESREYVNHLRRIAASFPPPYRGEVMHFTEWKFFRLRPENFPTLRIAGAARLIARFDDKEMLKTIIQLMKDDSNSSRTKYKFLQELLVIPADGFWQTHFRFGERATAPIRRLIGTSRADDIILNAVIPISLLYARIFKEPPLRLRVLKLFEECPPLSSNTVLTLLEHQLLQGKLKLDSAQLQQGALQLYKIYCMKERCIECPVGKTAFQAAG